MATNTHTHAKLAILLPPLLVESWVQMGSYCDTLPPEIRVVLLLVKGTVASAELNRLKLT